ncbi:hypothetical protein GIJ05_15200 [Laceyella tengchongensis]|nr:hypothetical protein [Laceyella tengchongensis]
MNRCTAPIYFTKTTEEGPRLHGYDPDHILRMLWERIYSLENRLQMLVNENEALQQQVKQLKPLHIDKIEYKIHELHVETLSGTLNIGLTATGEENGVGEIIEQVVKQQGNTHIGGDDDDTEDTAPPGD